MPNWCSNNLTLRHKDTEKLNAAIAAFERGGFFEHFVPLPDGKWDYGFCCEKYTLPPVTPRHLPDIYNDRQTAHHS